MEFLVLRPTAQIGAKYLNSIKIQSLIKERRSLTRRKSTGEGKKVRFFKLIIYRACLGHGNIIFSRFWI